MFMNVRPPRLFCYDEPSDTHIECKFKKKTILSQNIRPFLSHYKNILTNFALSSPHYAPLRANTSF